MKPKQKENPLESCFIIPSDNPTEEPVRIIENLIQKGRRRIIVVDDGSRKETLPYFHRVEELGVRVIHHEKNFGKGHSIKTGIQNAPLLFPDVSCIVTADSDGQHKADDICNIAMAAEQTPDQITLGSRDLKGQEIPFRSRFGNSFSAIYFRFLTGVRCDDTQTGLRGIPRQFFDFAANIPGERYDYEMNFLIEAARKRIPFQKIPIKVIYAEGNNTSHFRPVRDSLLIYKQPLRFMTSSLSSCVLDFSLFTLFIFCFQHFQWRIATATIFARCISGVFNYTLNKYWCFQSQKKRSGNEFLKYAALFLFIMCLSSVLVTLFNSIFNDVFVTIIKIFIDTALFLLSYKVQHSWVFLKKD